MRGSRFAIDFLGGHIFEGYTLGEEWNGFACPYFTFEQAQCLMEEWRASGRGAYFDAGLDRFTFEVDTAEGKDSDNFSAVELDGVKLYPIGASCWIWEEVA